MHNKSQQNAGYGGCFCCYIIWIFDATEAVTRGVLYKNVFLEISQNSQESACARVSFLREHLGTTASNETTWKKRGLLMTFQLSHKFFWKVKGGCFYSEETLLWRYPTFVCLFIALGKHCAVTFFVNRSCQFFLVKQTICKYVSALILSIWIWGNSIPWVFKKGFEC